MMSWHDSTMLNGDLRLYHDLLARYPKEEISRWARHLDDVTTSLKTLLERHPGNGSMRMIKIGSVPEHTCVKVPIENDLNFVVSYSESNVVVEKWDDPVGFYNITEKSNPMGAPICPKQFSDSYLKTLEDNKCGIPHFTKTSKMYARGVSSVMLDFKRKGSGELLFQVDVVPGIEVRRQKGPPDYYIPRKVPHTSADFGWLQTFAVKEKEILIQLDENDPRLMCFRIIKAIRDGNPELNRLWSVVIKNVILKHKDQGDWSIENLGARVVKCIQALCSAYCNGTMKKKFSPSVNLLANYRPEQLKAIYKRLCELIRDKEILTSFINAQILKAIEERGKSGAGAARG